MKKKKFLAVFVTMFLLISGTIVAVDADEKERTEIKLDILNKTIEDTTFLDWLIELLEPLPILQKLIINFKNKNNNVISTSLNSCLVSLPPDTITTITMTHSSGHPISDYSLQFWGIPSGYDISDDDSPYPGWCIDKSTISPASPPYPVVFYSTYCTPPKWDDPDWDKVNYLLNNLPAGYLVTDVRDAIYPFVNFGPGANPPLSAAAQAMVDDANANGSGFIPDPGQIVAVICDNNPTFTTTGDDGHPYQYFIIEVPVPEGYEGCTPGFWKTRGVRVGWPSPYDTSWTLEEAGFVIPGGIMDDNPRRPVDKNDTLIEALRYKGGEDVSGMAQSLLRAAVAALLNAAEEEVNYPLNVTEVITEVNLALATLDRDTMELLKNDLDSYNNLGADDWW